MRYKYVTVQVYSTLKVALAARSRDASLPLCALPISEIFYEGDIYIFNGILSFSFTIYILLGKPQKKVPPLMARPLRGGVTAGPLRKKEVF